MGLLEQNVFVSIINHFKRYLLLVFPHLPQETAKDKKDITVAAVHDLFEEKSDGMQ